MRTLTSVNHSPAVTCRFAPASRTGAAPLWASRSTTHGGAARSEGRDAGAERRGRGGAGLIVFAETSMNLVGPRRDGKAKREVYPDACENSMKRGLRSLRGQAPTDPDCANQPGVIRRQRRERTHGVIIGRRRRFHVIFRRGASKQR